MPKPTKKTKPSATSDDLPVIYPEVSCYMLTGDDAMDAARAQELLGWKSETEDDQFGDDYDFKDFNDVKVRCTLNRKNRPLNESWAYTIAQDIINRHWKLNGETIVVGKYASVLSGQHRMIGLILADQVFQKKADGNPRLAELWPESKIKIDVVLVTGIEETGEVTRTLDNVRPRTLADVLFCDDSVFGSVKAKERTKLTRMVDYSVRLLWQRMGADRDAFHPKRTHSEALDFIARHGHVMQAVKHIWKEDPDGKAARALTVPPGTCAAMLYLMGGSDSEYDKYHHARLEGNASERRMTWSAWDKACEFWGTLLKEFRGDAKMGTKTGMEAVRQAIASCLDPMSGTGVVTREMVLMILIKAWLRWKLGLPITLDAVQLEFKTLEDSGERVLAESPLEIGGVDIPPKFELKEDAPPEEDPAPAKPTKGSKKNKPATTVEDEDAAGTDGEDAVDDAMPIPGDGEDGEGAGPEDGDPDPVELALRTVRERERREKAERISEKLNARRKAKKEAAAAE